MSAPDSSAHVTLFGTASVVFTAGVCDACGVGVGAVCVSLRRAPQATAKRRGQSKRASIVGRIKCLRRANEGLLNQASTSYRAARSKGEAGGVGFNFRSEERRVGKECRC